MDIKELLGASYKDGMTAEEITAALAGIDSPDAAELKRLKEALTKSNSEAADYKRQLRQKQSDDEAKAQEDKEAREKLQSDYDALVKKVTESEYHAKFLSLGYEDKLARDTASALLDGKMDVVFENQKKHAEEVERRIRSEILNETPKPGQADNGNGGAVTLEALRKMPQKERMDYARNNPEHYKELYGGN